MGRKVCFRRLGTAFTQSDFGIEHTGVGSDFARRLGDYGIRPHSIATPFHRQLFQRVITVSLETMKIVRALPRLDIVVGGKS